MSDQDKHWLVRPETIRMLWLVFGGILALTVITGLFVEQYDHFGIEATFAFYAWYGFITCVGMVVGAKLLGIFLKRRETWEIMNPEDIGVPHGTEIVIGKLSGSHAFRDKARELGPA